MLACLRARINSFEWDVTVTQAESAQNTPARPLALLVLVGLLTLESLAIAGVCAWLTFELLTTEPDTLASGIAIVALGILATVWIIATTVGAFRMRTWMRGSVLTWQLLQIAVAFGCFQGQFAVPDVGWALLAPALAAIGLIFTPSVVAVTRRDPSSYAP